jgi:glyoxylase-like metal-dependent hydrolase (beta-lactamase superfamily II)
MRTIPLGNATITVFNVGDFTWKLAEKLNISDSEWRPHYAALFERPLLFPTQSIHLALPEASVLVDPSGHDLPPDPFSVPPDYRQPPDLGSQLFESGISAKGITHLVITHAHFDHYAYVTVEHDGEDVPRFPFARCFLQRIEWERPEIQQALQDPHSNESRTLGVLYKRGLLEFVEGDFDLLPGMRIIAAPGETPGHQIVRVHSEDQTLYCLGDLYHHLAEVEHPNWMVQWKDEETNLCSRRALMNAAIAENALLIAAHIPLGRLEPSESGVRWKAV